MTSQEVEEILDFYARGASVMEVFSVLATLDHDSRHWVYSQLMQRASSRGNMTSVVAGHQKPPQL